MYSCQSRTAVCDKMVRHSVCIFAAMKVLGTGYNGEARFHELFSQKAALNRKSFSCASCAWGRNSEQLNR